LADQHLRLSTSSLYKLHIFVLVRFAVQLLDRTYYVLQNPHDVPVYVQYLWQNTQNLVTWNHTHNCLWGYKASFLADQGFVGSEAYTIFGAFDRDRKLKLYKPFGKSAPASYNILKHFLSA
jgi:hypothetical protein